MKKIILIIGVLILALSLVLIRPKEEASIKIVQGDKEEIVSKDFIYGHTDSIEFPAVVRSSGKKPAATEYTGIEISRLFSSLDIDISNAQKVTFNATDGYRVIMDKKELEEANNVYLTFKRDGDYMKSKKQGGSGPFQLVIRKDPFSQRWIKHIDRITLE